MTAVIKDITPTFPKPSARRRNGRSRTRWPSCNRLLGQTNWSCIWTIAPVWWFLYPDRIAGALVVRRRAPLDRDHREAPQGATPLKTPNEGGSISDTRARSGAPWGTVYVAEENDARLAPKLISASMNRMIGLQLKERVKRHDGRVLLGEHRWTLHVSSTGSRKKAGVPLSRLTTPGSVRFCCTWRRNGQPLHNGAVTRERHHGRCNLTQHQFDRSLEWLTQPFLLGGRGIAACGGGYPQSARQVAHIRAHKPCTPRRWSLHFCSRSVSSTG